MPKHDPNKALKQAAQPGQVSVKEMASSRNSEPPKGRGEEEAPFQGAGNRIYSHPVQLAPRTMGRNI